MKYFFCYDTWDEFVRCELGAHIVFGSANTCTAHNSEDDFIVGEWDSVKEKGWVYL